MKQKLILLLICILIFSCACNKKSEEAISSDISDSSSGLEQESSINSEISSSSAASVPDTSPVISNDDSGIPDTVLYTAILSELGKQPGEKFTQNEALTVTFLNYGFESEKIKSITGIGYLKNLTFLHLAAGEITDITPALSLKKLKTLSLPTNKISDISAASAFTGLDTLNLAYNSITDISPLKSLTNLSELDLWYNLITDISPILNLTKLSTLSLEHNMLDMSSPSNISNVNTLKARIKYFALGIQGLNYQQSNFSEVNLYIDEQQTLDDFSNITYVSAYKNGTELKLNTFYKINEIGSYTLKLADSMKTDCYNISFNIISQ